ALAGLSAESRSRDSLRETQAHHDHFGKSFGRGDVVTLPRRMPVAFDRLQPRLGRPMLPRGELAAVYGDAAVGARAGADIIAIAPIGAVVAGFVTRPRMVGDLVGGHVGFGQSRGGPFEELRLVLFRRQGEIAAGVALLEGGAGLDGELIER